MEILPEGLMLEAETYNALITTMRRDCRVLESFRIMDYSLLIGIHNLDQAAKEQAVSLFIFYTLPEKNIGTVYCELEKKLKYQFESNDVGEWSFFLLLSDIVR